MPTDPRDDAELTVILPHHRGLQRVIWRRVVDDQSEFVERPRSTDRNQWIARNSG